MGLRSEGRARLFECLAMLVVASGVTRGAPVARRRLSRAQRPGVRAPAKPSWQHARFRDGHRVFVTAVGAALAVVVTGAQAVAQQPAAQAPQVQATPVQAVLAQAPQGQATQAQAPQAQSAPQAGGQGPVVAGAPRPVRAPLPNRVNEVLPAWLRVRGEFRERAERFDNLGFNATRDDGYFLSRIRLNATVAPSKSVAFQVQLQDARVSRKTVGPIGTPFKAAFDLRQAFADVGSATSVVRARVGRQELAYGDQRLLGHVNWLNAGRTFDAAKVTVASKALQVDLFAASVVRILDGAFDKSGNGNRLFGAYATTARVLPKGNLEPYLIVRRDANLLSETRVTGSLQQVTTGARLVGRLPAAFDYNVEMAMQRGSLASDSVSAWAGHWQLRRTFVGGATPHVTGEYNYASGDANPTDGTRGTFDILYPTPHDKLGLADQVSWKNTHHVRAGVDFTPFKATPIAVNYHSFWLAERRDGLYNAGGALLARVASGAASTHVGHEIDVQVARPLTPQLGVAAGYSYLMAGAFLKEATPGRSYSAPYVMLTYVFLADK